MNNISLWVLLGSLTAGSYQAVENTRLSLDHVLARAVTIVVPAHGSNGPRPHSVNRVLVFRDAARMTIASAGKPETLKSQDVRWLPAGAAYVVENVADRPIEFVEIELKNMPANPPVTLSALDPPAADSAHYTVIMENDQVRVLRAHYGPQEKGPVHEHLRNRVVVNFSPTTRARFGDVAMAGPGTHAEQNLTDQPEEKIATELK